jgi:hypothetical protein
MLPARCPNCGAELGKVSICQRCGSLPALEAAISKAKIGLTGYAQQKWLLLPQRFQGRHFLWLCAVIPLFILPPVFALVYSVVAMRKQQTPLSADFEWIAILSAVNIIVSAMVLYKLHFAANDLISSFSEMLQSALRRWFLFEAPRPTVKPMPV